MSYLTYTPHSVRIHRPEGAEVRYDDPHSSCRSGSVFLHGRYIGHFAEFHCDWGDEWIAWSIYDHPNSQYGCSGQLECENRLYEMWDAHHHEEPGDD